MPRTMRGMRGLSLAGLGLSLLVSSACGGGSSGGVQPLGALTLQAVWERPAAGSGAQFEGDSDVPASVQTVEVRIDAGDQTFSELVDPAETRTVLITNVPTGRVEVSVFGYDVPLLGAPDLRDVDVAPSYASEPVQVLVDAGRTTNAGAIDVLAEPFLTDFVPLPEAIDVDPSQPVAFLLAIGVGEIDAASVDIAVDGTLVVGAGVATAGTMFQACADGTAVPCETTDRGLNGFLFRGPSDFLPAGSRVTVSVQALGGPGFARTLDFDYGFETGS